MEYTELFIKMDADEQSREVVIALLADLGYESFMEDPQGLKAFLPSSAFDEETLIQLRHQLSNTIPFSYEYKLIPDQNWNAVWESNYDPVLIDGKVGIRAPFHSAPEAADYDIIIEPKMSFGTAHHPTTAMMVKHLLDHSVKQQNVLDMGCGTSVLAILASMQGAHAVDAVDNDEWAYENSLENVARNHCTNITVSLNDAAFFTEKHQNFYDTILANINRNILLQDLNKYAAALNPGGKLIMSGFYESDLKLVDKEAKKYGLILDRKKVEKDWCAATWYLK
jgi:ribosomal protein L11 methyltransferase